MVQEPAWRQGVGGALPGYGSIAFMAAVSCYAQGLGQYGCMVCMYQAKGGMCHWGSDLHTSRQRELGTNQNFCPTEESHISKKDSSWNKLEILKFPEEGKSFKYHVREIKIFLVIFFSKLNRASICLDYMSVTQSRGSPPRWYREPGSPESPVLS